MTPQGFGFQIGILIAAKFERLLKNVFSSLFVDLSIISINFDIATQ